ncbi:MAG: type II toxin-antitoxin system prevent-host-death family antitoxin [Acidobacteria bacterium]|nr:type II toxin-antitoxin system prevent-host-death family antitoxin [Acidobacteriota bacterium]MBV9148181.1 type II toxin-antitoxin system prevent-host-death family antitoxin [Acidobacteriota bacterium]MBV9434636.1 type II toxin-antitoxin system prevent-host-death family antitoxin [Acidobacteriota bacterium]
MPAGIFKSKCLAVMEEIQAKRISIVITKRGKPIVEVVPVVPDKDPIFGFMKGKVKIVGDIVSPIFEPDEWELD